MSTQDLFTIKTQRTIISTTTNGSMLFSSLMGVYTIVYLTTMYTHLSKAAASVNRRVILTAISVLYLLCSFQFALQWYSVSWSVVTNGDTRESIFFAALQGGPQWMWVIDECLFYAPLIVSDGLLIWRCYNVWGQSLRILLILLVLFIAEIGLYVATVSLEGSQSLLTSSDATVILANKIITASIIASLSTTVISTFLIWYRVYSVSRENGPLSSKIFFHVVVLVFESAALYSLALLLNAITTFVPSFTVVGSGGDEANYYMEIFLIVTAAMSPTILVARVALTNKAAGIATRTEGRISGLRFEDKKGGVASNNAPG